MQHVKQHQSGVFSVSYASSISQRWRPL